MERANLQIHQIIIHKFTIHKVSGIQPNLHEWDSTYTTVPARKALCLLWQYGLWSFQTGDTKLVAFCNLFFKVPDPKKISD